MKLNGNQLLEQLNWRYAVKKFDSQKKISAQDWEALEKALVLTPSSYGLQPWKFFVIRNEEIRNQLTPLSWNQTQVKDCSHFVVLTASRAIDEEHVKKYVRSTAKIREIAVEALKGFQDMMIGDVVKGARSKVADIWAAKQCYIAAGNLMTSAALMGIDTCPMEGIDPAGYDKILGIAGGEFHTVMAIACGYRSADDALAKMKKSRFEVSEVVTHL
jgi:nitroreductase